MDRRSAQAPSAVIMVRPHHFLPNEQTAQDNAFQRMNFARSESEISKDAYEEATEAAKTLEGLGVRVHIFEDESTKTPDSVFPNNWFSTHPGGHVAIYPMFAENRRLERRYDVIEMLKSEYRVQDIIDYSGLEPDGLFLEGTGAMVLDHIDRTAYAIKSGTRYEMTGQSKPTRQLSTRPWPAEPVDAKPPAFLQVFPALNACLARVGHCKCHQE